VGRIEPLKGVDTLIQAMSCLNLAGLHRPVHLAIIGGEPNVQPEDMSDEMSRLQKMCDELCVGGMVLFLGKRGQDTLPYYYSAAELLVMPSLYESFGMVALEAMACGTPVIASEVGGLGYLVQDGVTGYTIPDSDPEALCDKLSRLLGDAHLRETMGLGASQYALDYAWEKIAAQMIAVYSELVEKEKV
jgi:D-inositol-3-phosphate glycosyltransferase